VGFVVDKVELGQVFSEYLGFHCHFVSTDFFIITIIICHLGLVQYTKTVTAVPSGLSLTPCEKKIVKKLETNRTLAAATELHGVISQEIVRFVGTAMIASNPIELIFSESDSGRVQGNNIMFDITHFLVFDIHTVSGIRSGICCRSSSRIRISPVSSTCHANLMHLDIILAIFGEEYKL
jgi:hypothetical protein